MYATREPSECPKRARASWRQELDLCDRCACPCMHRWPRRTAWRGALLSLRLDLDSLLLLHDDDDEDEEEEDTEAADSIRLEWQVAHDAPIYAVAEAEPSLLVAATGDACILHQRETGCVLRRLAAGSGILYALALNPCNDCLLAAGSEEIVHVFNFPSGTKRAELHLPHGSAHECSLNSAAINALAFLDDRTFVSEGTTRLQRGGSYAITSCLWRLWRRGAAALLPAFGQQRLSYGRRRRAASAAFPKISRTRIRPRLAQAPAPGQRSATGTGTYSRMRYVISHVRSNI